MGRSQLPRHMQNAGFVSTVIAVDDMHTVFAFFAAFSVKTSPPSTTVHRPAGNPSASI